MITMHYTANKLIDHAKAWLRADEQRMINRPAGRTRAAWRGDNPIDLPTEFTVIDTAYKTLPRRVISLVNNESVYDAWVFETGKRSAVVERIDLRSADANERLARYLVDQSVAAT